MPPPTGSGPAVALVASTWGPSRLVAIDDQDRPLAYGFGPHPLFRMAPCPDGATVAGLTSGARSVRVERWNIASLTLTAGWDFKPGFYPEQVRCDASEVVAWGEGGSARVALDGTITYDAAVPSSRPAERTVASGLRFVAEDGSDIIAASQGYPELESALLRIKPDGKRLPILSNAFGMNSTFLKLSSPVAITSVAVAAPRATTTAPSANSTTTVVANVAIDPDGDGGATWLAPAAAAAGLVGATALFVVVRRRRRSLLR
jgi:hypothetical protein